MKELAERRRMLARRERGGWFAGSLPDNVGDIVRLWVSAVYQARSSVLNTLKDGNGRAAKVQRRTTVW